MTRAGISIKKEQRQSFLFREFSRLFHETALDEPALLSIFLTRVELSPGNGVCTLYFSTTGGREDFLTALEILKLYKPSFRSAFAKIRQTRYTPEFIFAYDEAYNKSQKMNEILDTIQTDSNDEE